MSRSFFRSVRTLREQRSGQRLAAIAVLTQLACAGVSHRTADDDAVLRHYLRTNRDGSSPEHVVHFRPNRADVAVYKWVRRCDTAAYVTARLDPATWEPSRLDAGKVGPDGHQQRFGSISLDAVTRTLNLHIDLEAGALVDTATVPAGMPWFLFDYDLGDLNSYLQETRPTADFRFAWALVWPGSDDMLTSLATVHASHRGVEPRAGRPARRFDLQFIAGRPGEGTLWIHPDTGAIVEAEASLPNHPGMTDFRLKLDHETAGGRAAWHTLLAKHHANCPD